MNDAKPTCGWNESKPTILYSTCEQWLFGYKTSKEVVKFDLPIKVSKGSTFSFSEGSVPVLASDRDGTEPITAEWLVDKWGYYYEYEDDPQSDNSLRNFTKVSFRIKNGDLTLRFLGNKIENPPKTRDEFRSFAKWFGLEEKE